MTGIAQEQSDNTPPALQVSGLAFGYSGQADLLRGIELQIRPGERVGLIGNNGSGKTTLFLLVCGVLKPRSGSLHLFGNPVQAGHFRPEIGMVFQNPADQLICPSVREDVAFGPGNLGLPAGEVARRVNEALEAVGMLHLADRAPHQLSGGERRMVAIAGVLAMRPQLLIYDEPDANLDRRSRRRLIRFLQASSQTLLIASHDFDLIGDVCERVIILDSGQLVADGPTALIMRDHALLERYGLDSPATISAPDAAE